MNLSALTVLGILAIPLAGQQAAEDWALRQPFVAAGSATALHPVTGRPVLFGGNDSSIGGLSHLWEWQGGTWARHVATPEPLTRSGHAMALHEQRRHVLMFGGSTWLPRETWTWDGSRWQLHPTPVLLTMRTDFPMAYDSRRGRVVLFSGSIAVNDTWEWDGSSWILCQPGAPPAARSGHRMAFDAARGRMVMFGGRAGSAAAMNETWEWDGTWWTQRFPATQPLPRSQHAMGYDPLRARVVLFGGSGGLFSTTSDTWEWDGSNWTLVPTLNAPPVPALILPTNGPSLEFDRTRGRLVLFNNDVTGAVWEYDGINWAQVSSGSSPPLRYSAAMIDIAPSGPMVLFGGRNLNIDLADTWTWDGRRWARVATAQTPSARSGHGLVFDAARGLGVLFGGYTYSSGSGTVVHDDTWTWNGAWTRLQPANRPPRRSAHGLAWHAPTQRVVLFGGADHPTFLGDTWTWNGTDWQQENPAAAPSARTGVQMTGMTQDVVLFGGLSGTGANITMHGDTWRWDGTTWTQLQPAVSPPPRSSAGCTFDRDRGRVLILSGYPLPSSASAPADAWAFDGVNWSQLNTPTSPVNRNAHALVYDPRQREVVLFGGMRFREQNDTWTLAAAALQETFGAGCTGTLGVPSLQTSAQSIPEPGGAVIVDLSNLPASLALMMAGFSRTAAGTQALPLALQPFGMPGCDLLVSPDANVLVMGTANAATWLLPLPATPSLCGVEFFHQAFVFDPAANAAGFTTSNAGRCRIGN